MLITPSFDEIAEEVTPGEYEVRIAGADAGEWSTGTKYVKWILETQNSPEPKNNGRKIFYSTPVSGKGAFLAQRFYKAATGEPLTGPFDTEQLLGKGLKVTVEDGVNRQTGEKTGYIEVSSVKPIA